MEQLNHSFLLLRFSWLPVTEDVDEAPYVYGFLADLIESNNQHVLGSNNSNLPRVIAIIAEALATEVLPPEDVARQRLVNLVKQVQVNKLGRILKLFPNALKSRFEMKMVIVIFIREMVPCLKPVWLP